MTYYELIISAYRKINANEITLGEYEKMITPLNREIVPEWIPINNKSPQDGQHIFISTVTGKIHDVVWNSECINSFSFVRNGCWYKTWFVIAWMPFFITPYKVGSEDKDADSN